METFREAVAAVMRWIGAGGLAVMATLTIGMWVIFDRAADQQPLDRTETAGLVLASLIAVVIGKALINALRYLIRQRRSGK